MKLMRVGNPGKEVPAILDSQGIIRDLSAHVSDIDGNLFADDSVKRIAGIDLSSLPAIDKNVRIGPAISKVGKFICVGLNYADHAAESGMDVPSEPVLFMKATSSIIGPNDTVELPPASKKSDWEVELGVVIGKETKYVSEKDALAHIAGYCVINDLSEREFQIEKEGQWCKGKGCDTFGPIGPYLVTTDEITDSNELDIWLELNGERVQNGNTRTMVYKVPFLVSYISQFMSLQPGDIISTGTPPGVGLGFNPPKYLKEGDVMRLGISGLGEQQQKVERYKA
ncbi:fumarylacetoacetate hydrolase family protein [Thalassotalea piscium]|uniref:Ureidoglycolate lyase/2,4-diketo-3-deoxy-L-fuconate hydrolase n=1 Tax=Thalassotalea piscium TaxID=1230533 RepID=A0A7X0NG82_9GAMM|nr:fumarylacetoacetate hydrolase family protein [Thalassotalea piscium]MBB6542883.1 ureidoglycolate lyase/2,4-diketo-3-deoxy-L-fuconate hydrolase [Thalassotalea piscium]